MTMSTPRLDALLQALHAQGGAALHLQPGAAPALRRQRRLHQLPEPPVSASWLDECIRDLLFADHRRVLQQQGHVEVLYVDAAGRRYRVLVCEQEGRHAVILRPVPAVPARLEQLRLPQVIQAQVQQRAGLLLVGGHAGSGKGTTLQALIVALQQDPTRHIVTVEAAIECVHPPGAALLHQREVGVHVQSAVAGIQQAIAVGADALVVTAALDQAAVDAAIAAAEAGCLVVVGMEAGSAAGALNALLSPVAMEQRPRLRARLARVLRMATAQQLVVVAPAGGRRAAVEVLVGSPAVRRAIRSGQFGELPELMDRQHGLGMQSMAKALRELQGETGNLADGQRPLAAAPGGGPGANP
jgi:Tfp pilus assembly pilus retraction ATPase PilT